VCVYIYIYLYVYIKFITAHIVLCLFKIPAIALTYMVRTFNTMARKEGKPNLQPLLGYRETSWGGGG